MKFHLSIWLLLGLLLAGCGQNGTAPANPSAAGGQTAVTFNTTDTLLTIHIDTRQNVHPISPLIYGLSGATADYISDMQPTLNSWGGNPSSRYNWEHGRAWNAGSDWFFRNGNYGYQGESASDDFLTQAQAANMAVRLAVPTVGWVAKNDDNNTCSFPLANGDCGNGNNSNCDTPNEVADPNRANVPSTPDTVRAWLRHINQKGFPVRFVAADNEPELWGYTHYDVHPKCTTYAEILQTFLAYATAVRAELPTAEITGPVTCCWWYYWNSAAGEADKEANDNQDFLPWFLDQVRQHDESSGGRTLDVLDIHYYPEGVYNSNVDPDTAALRLRSTRSLWDPTYADESWIDEPIYLLPRMKQLLADHYPGTKLGLSEWNWGADETMNGALAIADVLGILGREDVYFAAYWRVPPLQSPGYNAFKLYTNFDGQGSRFGDTSVLALPEDGDKVSSYAALDSSTGNLHVMLVNKGLEGETAVQINLNHFTPQPQATQYRLANGIPGVEVTAVDGATANFATALPPYSITLLVLQPVISNQ